MKHRNPLAVFFLPFITFGIYALVWQVKTKNEMNRLGAQIPTAWLIIVPLVNIWWLWKYSEGVDHVSGSKLSTPLTFVLLFLLGTIGAAIIQSEFNKVDSASAGAATPQPEITPTPAATNDTDQPAAQPVTSPEQATAEPAATVTPTEEPVAQSDERPTQPTPVA